MLVRVAAPDDVVRNRIARGAVMAAVTGSVSSVAGPRPSSARSTARSASRPSHTAEPSSPSSHP
ncbi:hypothetical protein OHA72_59305 [Dactylosporangium sp. NBC_01737]|uniref:hypothetical protein n=1 Tax=Dactylosporangium sp. NBC_01737 TaxID=2975959 RepID=UPI002E0FE908|nr:hypothetical protein OHA72_59305 [Dactylosporangium sp. NBC_01737]